MNSYPCAKLISNSDAFVVKQRARGAHTWETTFIIHGNGDNLNYFYTQRKRQRQRMELNHNIYH